MTPFRSYIVVASVAGAVAILGTVQMKGGVITYVMVSFFKLPCVCLQPAAYVMRSCMMSVLTS